MPGAGAVHLIRTQVALADSFFSNVGIALG